MPKLKTLSEVATVRWLSGISNGTDAESKGPRVKVVVPEIYDWDSNPWNRVGGEWILMQKVCSASSVRTLYSLPAGAWGPSFAGLSLPILPLPHEAPREPCTSCDTAFRSQVGSDGQPLPIQGHP